MVKTKARMARTEPITAFKLGKVEYGTKSAPLGPVAELVKHAMAKKAVKRG